MYGVVPCTRQPHICIAGVCRICFLHEYDNVSEKHCKHCQGVQRKLNRRLPDSVEWIGPEKMIQIVKELGCSKALNAMLSSKAAGVSHAALSEVKTLLGCTDDEREQGWQQRIRKNNHAQAGELRHLSTRVACINICAIARLSLETHLYSSAGFGQVWDAHVFCVPLSLALI